MLLWVSLSLLKVLSRVNFCSTCLYWVVKLLSVARQRGLVL